MCLETLGLHSQEQKQTQAKLENHIIQYTLDSHSENFRGAKKPVKMLSTFAKTSHLVAPVETFASKNITQWENPIFNFWSRARFATGSCKETCCLCPEKLMTWAPQEGFSKAFLKARLLGAGVGWQVCRGAGVQFSDGADDNVTGGVPGLTRSVLRAPGGLGLCARSSSSQHLPFDGGFLRL